jgi:hypothetical protein
MPKAVAHSIPVSPSPLHNLPAGDIADQLGSLKPEMAGKPENLPMKPLFSHALAAHERCRALLEERFPEIDDEALRDTLEGISELPEMLATILRSQLDDLALAAALKSRLAGMQERLSRIADRAEKKRTLVAAVMERADLRKITDPEFTASLRPTPPPLVVTAEGDIPSTYWKPQAPKLDRGSLLAALKAGECIPGATLGNGGVTIAVRTR